MTLYMNEVAPKHAHPELVAFHAGPLLEFFGRMTCWDITASTCNGYVRSRLAGLGERRPVKQGTARRELETLGAACTYAYKARAISKPIIMHLPEKSPPRERHLTRSEAARLLAGSLGWKTTEIDDHGRAVKWQRAGPPSYNVARFILSSLYTARVAKLCLRCDGA